MDKFWASWEDYAEKLVKRTYEKCSDMKSGPLDVVDTKSFEKAPVNHPVKMLFQAYTFLDENHPNKEQKTAALRIIKKELDAVLALQEWLNKHPEGKEIQSTIDEFSQLQGALNLIENAPFVKKTNKFKKQIERMKDLSDKINNVLKEKEAKK
jgi:hypothetical protein